MTNKLQGKEKLVQQHPMSRNIAFGRSSNNWKARRYAGILAILSFANPNPRTHGYGQTYTIFNTAAIWSEKEGIDLPCTPPAALG